MPNISWRQFHEYVMPNVQGCPVGIVNNAIRNSAIEFCEKSLLWKLESEPTDIIAGQPRYTFSPPEGARVAQPVFASINNFVLFPTSLDDLDTLHYGWRELEQERPVWYFMDTEDSIRLVGIPQRDMEKALEVHVALKPSRTSAECPDFLLEDWAEVIAHGALHRLHAMAGKSWAKPELVDFHYSQFRAGLSRAKSKSIKSRQTVAKSVTPRRFGEF